MEVRVCKNCRRLFKYIYGPDLCPECVKLIALEKAGLKEDLSVQNDKNSLDSKNYQKTFGNKTLTPALKNSIIDENAKFEQVRDYIMANPRASVSQIAEVNDVPPTKLFEWIKDDRLEFSEGSEYAWFNCEKCGAKIRSGRLCNRCKIK